MCKRILALLLFLCVGMYSFAQTCCSAGAPVSTFLDIANANEKSLSFQLNYEYKSINLLVDNNTRLENDPRTRSGQSLSFKMDYTLNSKWAFSAILPLVHHSRSTLSEQQKSTGIGDLSLLAQYSIYSSPIHNLNVSGGIKLPTGVTSHKTDSQIFISPDMQSGSGSIDFLLRASYSKSDFLMSFLTATISTIYRKNGTNNGFGSVDNFAGRSFAFGDEFTSVFGLRYLKTYDAGFLIPDASLKVRWGGANTEQGSMSSNSGGRWLSLPLGISFVPDESKSIRLYGELPLYQDLEGLQITTDFIIGIQFTYNKLGNKY